MTYSIALLFIFSLADFADNTDFSTCHFICYADYYAQKRIWITQIFK